MPWEIIADFQRGKELPPEHLKWGSIACGLVCKLVELEPLLRFRIRNLPTATRQAVYFPLASSEVPAALQDRLEVPDPETRWVRQYYCHTCKPEGATKPKWVPQMYLAAHKGHELTRSEPTGKTKMDSWSPNYRLFIGPPDRLKGLRGSMYSGALTTLPVDVKDLKGFDVLLLLPSKALEEEGIVNRVKRAASTEDVILLPAKPVDAVAAMLAWMKRLDAKALDSVELDEETEAKAAENARARIAMTEAWMANKLKEKAQEKKA